MKDNANDTTRSPFVVPGQDNPEPKTRSTTHDPTTSTPTNPFRWVVPNGSVTGAESNPTTHGTEAEPTSHDHGDPQSHDSTRINDHNDRTSDDHNDNDALDRLGPPRRLSLVPNAPNPQPGGDTQSNGLIHPYETEGGENVTGNRSVSARASKDSIPTDQGSVRLLEDHDTLTGYVDDDDPFILNGHSEDEQPSPDETLFILNGGLRVDEVPGGDRDATLGDATRVSTGVLGGNGIIDQGQLREGVQIGTVKRELLDYRPKPRRASRQKKHYPFSPQIPKILDFLTRWRIGTTVQLARVAGWRDSNEGRVLKKLRSYDEVGFMRETDLYAGPKIWTATTRGAELGFHPWLGGVKPSEINPMSQSHAFGLSSIASWLLCPWDETPNILGLAPDEWNQVRGEIKAGTAWVLAEKEYRSSYSSIRSSGRGLLPAEYRHGFIGGPGVKSGAWREWALRFKTGDVTLDESPELLACDPEFMGANMWMWIIWGNGVWNPKVLEDRASIEVDVDDPEWSGRAGELRLRSEFRHLGYVPIEERLDIATNRPVINKALGDRFALWDHLPDLIIARRRTDDEYADPQSIAIELELTAKPTDAYARTMAAYGSTLGQTLYRKVIWLVSSKTIADRIREGARQVGMVLGEDYDIVPFVTSNKVSVIKRSFYSGSDILPGRWNSRGLIEPTDGRSIPLA